MFVWYLHTQIIAIWDYLEDQDYDIHIHPSDPNEETFSLDDITKFAEEWKKELEQEKDDEESHNGHRKD